MNKVIGAALLALFTSLPALAGVVVIGHSEGAATIDKETVTKLFLGKTTRFNGATVKLFELSEGSSERQAFHAATTGRSDAQLQSNWSRLVFSGKAQAPVVQEDAAAMISAVAGTPNAIGYVDEAAVSDDVKVLLKL
ncbi:hypothetical protein [Ferrimonas senticii]|uniref:hypothetical protein n=1 Tax=Ferrimonas senticii TaxID=394566 RepID=UPI0003F89F54|nr:hypothetical protein [Ferrimonas senticii]